MASTNNMVNYKLTISGKVQGVSYRASARSKASELKLGGFVKNLKNGSVFAEVEGPEDIVRQFIDWCHYGPPMAKVDKIEIETSEIKGYHNFEVKF